MEIEVNINISVNNGSDKLKKNIATSGKLIIAVYASVVYVYKTKTLCVAQNSVFAMQRISQADPSGCAV
jgi:hypothetical protein